MAGRRRKRRAGGLGGLSTGAKAGLAISAAVAVGGLGYVGYRLFKKEAPGAFLSRVGPLTVAFVQDKTRPRGTVVELRAPKNPAACVTAVVKNGGGELVDVDYACEWFV